MVQRVLGSRLIKIYLPNYIRCHVSALIDKCDTQMVNYVGIKTNGQVRTAAHCVAKWATTKYK